MINFLDDGFVLVNFGIMILEGVKFLKYNYMLLFFLFYVRFIIRLEIYS